MALVAQIAGRAVLTNGSLEGQAALPAVCPLRDLAEEIPPTGVTAGEHEVMDGGLFAVHDPHIVVDLLHPALHGIAWAYVTTQPDDRGAAPVGGTGKGNHGKSRRRPVS